MTKSHPTNSPQRFALRGQLVLPNRVMHGEMLVDSGRIIDIRSSEANPPSSPALDMLDFATWNDPKLHWIEVESGWVVPGFVDLHVHGGYGSDFMDGTEEAFETVLRSHLRHGTTAMTPTTTVATHPQILTALELGDHYKRNPLSDGSQVLGMHFYGPYFRLEARGAHPGGPIRPPIESEIRDYLRFADSMATATIAPEVEGTEYFARQCIEHGVRVNIGHSWATFQQVRSAVEWGARHVDHLYCAMSDRSRLRQSQPFPMRAGVLEATLALDELTTEVIADGVHLDEGLLLAAWMIKGSDRLCLVTDCNRALDMPDGTYCLGPLDGGEPLVKRGAAGLTVDEKGLASSVQGMDSMVRNFYEITRCPLHEVIKMASLTPARIVGVDHLLGSLEIGKRADFLILNQDLTIQKIHLAGQSNDLGND